MEEYSLAGKRVFITGADGFIGSHLVRRAIEEKAEIHALTINEYNIPRIKDIVPKINIWEGDLRDIDSLKRGIRSARPQIIFHLASLKNVDRDPLLLESMYDANVKGTFNLIRAVIDENIKIEKFINTGTCEEYGDSIAPFHEEMRERPVSPYSASKTATTHLCQMLYKSLGMPTVTVRPFLTYGPTQDTSLFIPSLINHCLLKKEFKMTDGEQTREFNYVDDIVEGFLLVAKSSRVIGEIINIGNGVEYKIKDVAKKIVKMMDSPIKLSVGVLPHRPGEVMRFFSNSDKARVLLGWAPKVNLDEGLERTIKQQKEDYDKTR